MTQKMTTESDALARICADTSLETARRKAATPLEAIREQARNAKPTRGFARALVHTATDRFALIAEIKKASPSGGLIRPDFDPAALARAYAAAGATCLSVLTDAPYFQGHADYLRAARAAVELPVLRKDFILDPWQVYETRAMGADCILLIIAALTDDEARELEQLAHALGLDVLVEVHNREELDRALSLQSRLIGINNRNLKTLKTDLAVFERLAPRVPTDRLLVAESGLRDTADLRRMTEARAGAFLVGESLLRQPDLVGATRALLGLKSR